MELPSSSYREYLELVTTVLATIAILQYTGIGFGRPGEFDFTYLAVVGLSLPVFTYLLTVAGENSSWVSQWNRMVQRDE